MPGESPSSTSSFAPIADPRLSPGEPPTTPTEPLGFELAGDMFIVDDDPQLLISLLIQRTTSPHTASRVMSH